MYRRRVGESETEPISDYLPTPDSLRTALAGRAAAFASFRFPIRAFAIPSSHVENPLSSFLSLLLCTPLAGFQFYIFFLQSHDPSFVL